MKVKFLYSTIAGVLFSCLLVHAQAPAGYYNTADGKTGYTLKTALFNIIKNHQVNSYSDLWDFYKTGDVRDDGTIWDMYSDNPNGAEPYTFQPGTAQCGNYSQEGDCYNREHSFPKSWFNDASPMYTDVVHIVPTDGYVNSRRSNYPYGETDNPTYTSQNGSELGPSSSPGYTGTVFEPIDEYKGDFARIYFYMATCYQDRIAGWEKNASGGDAVLDGTSDKVFEDWFLQVLLKWDHEDPVSQKERDRNNAIYNYQGNRNPYVDHPEWVDCIWDNNCSGTGSGSNATAFTFSTTVLDFGNVAAGDTSVLSYQLSGSNLPDTVVIKGTADFQVAWAAHATFADSLILKVSGQTVSDTTVYVQFAPAVADGTQYEDSIYHHTDSVNVGLAVRGRESTPQKPELNFLIASTSLKSTESFYSISIESDKAGSFQPQLVLEQFDSMSNYDIATNPEMQQDTVSFSWPSNQTQYAIGLYPDTTALKTDVSKSFRLRLLAGEGYTVGSDSLMTVTFEPYEAPAPVVSGLEEGMAAALHIYPNPVRGTLKIKDAKDRVLQWTIWDAQGRKILNGQGKHYIEIQTSKVPEGPFILRLTTKSGQSLSKFLINQ